MTSLLAGVPKVLDPVIHMLQAVRDFSSGSGAPWIVHCSAGIGRTGTFIAIDHGIQQLEENGTTDVVEIVRRLRIDRGGMVQHTGVPGDMHDHTHSHMTCAEQAEFIHRVLLRYAELNSAQGDTAATGTRSPVPIDADDDPVLIQSIEKAERFVPNDFVMHPSQVDTDEGAAVCEMCA